MRASRFLNRVHCVLVSASAAACANPGQRAYGVLPGELGATATATAPSGAPIATVAIGDAGPEVGEPTKAESPATGALVSTSEEPMASADAMIPELIASADAMTGADPMASADAMASTEPITSIEPEASSAPAMTSAPSPTMAPPIVSTAPVMTSAPSATMAPPNPRSDGPCDIYNAADTPCVAAYSTIRALLSTYDGPLYQVRSGSSGENTGSGGETHDIGMTDDGFADAAAQDAVCAGTICTVSKLYDQSGKGNDLTVAKKGTTVGGDYAGLDDFESLADSGPLTVGGRDVYSLYMETREGYRQTVVGNDTPRGTEPQGIYMLADGMHSGTQCCWEFGNVTETPTEYHNMNSLFLGTAYWGKGAGAGPWFMADFEAGVWAGGSVPGDPGWGGLEGAAATRPANPNNPSLKVPFAIGFLKTDEVNWGLSMANLTESNALFAAYEGSLPKPMDNQGAIVLGVAGDNSNNSWGTFFEGAVVAGYPSAATELAVMQNVQAVGYGE